MRTGNNFLAVIQLFIVTALFMLPGTLAQAAGFALDPTRVTFEGRTRSQEVFIINRGSTTSSYRIFFQEMAMDDDGSLVTLETTGPDDNTASQMLRYSPRQVTLRPGTSQQVRLLVRKPKDLAPGEYRSHLVVEELPDADAGHNIEALDKETVSVSMRAHFRLVIPIIIRHGDTSATASLSDPVFFPELRENGPAGVKFRLQRQGNQSVYGDFNIRHISPTGNMTDVAAVKGLALYAPNQSREVVIPFNLATPEKLDEGQLHIEFHSRPEETLLAETTLAL